MSNRYRNADPAPKPWRRFELRGRTWFFLDVQMPECGGFEVLELLKGDESLPVIVFVTAYDEYALRGLRRRRAGLSVEAFR